MSVIAVPRTPSELALFEGRQMNNFLGTLSAATSNNDNDELHSNKSASKTLGVCFVAEGSYDILVEVTEVDELGRPLPVREKNMTTKLIKVIVGKE